MWERLSLRTRLWLPLGLMFVAALLVGGISLRIFAPTQLMEEVEPAARSAKAVAAALNGALRTSTNPQATLDAFVQSLGSSEAIRFRRLGTDLDVHPPEVQTPLGTVPDWFVRLIAIPEFKAAFPVMIEGKQVGDIVFAPDMSADIYEKWIGFLAIICSGITLMLLTGIIAHFTARSALRPLQTLGDGLTRMRTGDYEQQILPAGPPEIRKSSQEANELARTLNRLSQDNRSLLRRIVSLQDDERQDMARELHDELGPLLFGIRANTVALLESVPSGEAELKNAAEGILQSVETLQQANRRILDRLRPLYIQELGLEKSIQTLLQNVKVQAPDLKVTSQIDADLNEVDGLLSQTVYRVIQEAVTNVLRHAKASSMHVATAINDSEVTVEVSDDGVGFPADRVFGRGLTGMLERVRALSGTLELLREAGRTCVRCRLPAGDSASDARGAQQS
ncbi:HAMP domain-containing protein [Bradyrhizobium sp. CSA112]|uniref:histidine kinase n=1 Tax=Bradyrhizobium sp. CSA112 TaxID=2699170 RepID=UPI0023B0CDD2|nr:histidine kinase [Bradyrhizobium sp. CSA112]MDE5455661.1 HAMP domain-containing protein [Bradyrhizobium sp. CSA112]